MPSLIQPERRAAKKLGPVAIGCMKRRAVKKLEPVAIWCINRRAAKKLEPATIELQVAGGLPRKSGIWNSDGRRWPFVYQALPSHARICMRSFFRTTESDKQHNCSLPLGSLSLGSLSAFLLSS